jgi:hypothetical protein
MRVSGPMAFNYFQVHVRSFRPCYRRIPTFLEIDGLKNKKFDSSLACVGLEVHRTAA